jgi:hypothetical protein
MSFSIGIALILVAFIGGIQGWRLADRRRAMRSWKELARSRQRNSQRFEPSMVAGLPEPVRRYFGFMIEDGAPLRTVVQVRTTGEIGLGTKEAPKYRRMRAEQILAPPCGLVWNTRTTSGLMRICGSDVFDGETSGTRFWLMGSLPVVRAGGSRDHARAAFGRVVAEAVFWAPAALLPASGVTWKAIAADVARATVTRNDLSQTVDVRVADDERPTMVVISRWSDANPKRIYQLQPFGGYLSEFRSFDGYRLSVQVEAGNFFGSDDYFPFYKVNVTDIHFIDG